VPVGRPENRREGPSAARQALMCPSA
jgi:hypothetical protein